MTSTIEESISSRTLVEVVDMDSYVDEYGDKRCSIVFEDEDGKRFQLGFTLNKYYPVHDNPLTMPISEWINKVEPVLST